jgi:glycosyltransferase A (GT-A) superfamily protein (DUF2064 family)
MTNKVVLIFSKVPIPGLVKTRLVEDTCLTIEDTALIAEAMLKDTIALVSKSVTDRIDIGFFPENKFSVINKIVKDVRSDGLLTKKILFHPQIGSNFDERFSSVVKAGFLSKAKNLIILGADLPYLEPSIIEMAFDDLNYQGDNKKVIIGPASGGGIYLVGINRTFDPMWFKDYRLFEDGIELNHFADFCRKMDFNYYLLPPFFDIDLEEDLVNLITLIKAIIQAKRHESFYFPRYTLETIESLGLDINFSKENNRNRKISKIRREYYE